jgi:outer membrane autotransporter protein
LAAPTTVFTIAAADGDRTIQDLSGVAESRVELGANTLTEGTGNSTQFDGTIVGDGGLIKQGSGGLILNGVNPYTGPTQIIGGGIVVGDAGHVDAALAGGGVVTVADDTFVGGYGRIAGDVQNDGVVTVGAATPLAGGDGLANFRIDGTLTNNTHVQLGVDGRYGNVLTVGSYVGADATLALNTVLGSDDSPTDRLVIRGGRASGTTTLLFETTGEGDLTRGDGILIVDAQNGATTTPGSFTATGRLTTPLYDYTFSRGGVVTPSPENWYLRSTYRAELSLDAAVTPLTQLYGLALVGTLHERVGDEERLRAREDLRDRRWVNGAWGRVLYRNGDWDGGGLEADGPPIDYDLFAVQGGVDLFRREHDRGSREHIGVLGSMGRVTSDVTADVGTKAGDVTMDLQSFGAYWTHFGDTGWYVDGLVQVSWIDATLTSTRMGMQTHGTGLTAAVEGGYPFALGSRMVLEPQVQLVYQRTALDPVTDDLTTITFDDAASFTGRLGARVSRSWGQPTTRPSTLWGRVSVWKEFDGESRFHVSTATLGANLGQSWLDLGVGGDVRVKGPFTLYGALGYQTALEGNRSAFTGNGGLRLNW